MHSFRRSNDSCFANWSNALAAQGVWEWYGSIAGDWDETSQQTGLPGHHFLFLLYIEFSNSPLHSIAITSTKGMSRRLDCFLPQSVQDRAVLGVLPVANGRPSQLATTACGSLSLTGKQGNVVN